MRNFDTVTATSGPEVPGTTGPVALAIFDRRVPETPGYLTTVNFIRIIEHETHTYEYIFY